MSSNSGKKFKPVNICHICQGDDPECDMCEGTGVMLLDEDNQEAQIFLNNENFDLDDE